MQKDCYLLNETPSFTLRPYEELRFDLKLEPLPKNLGCVEGWVRPLVKGCVKAFDLCLNPIEHTYTGLHGSYRLDLAAGYYYVAAVAPGYNLSPLVRIRVLPNRCQTVNFWLTILNNISNLFI